MTDYRYTQKGRSLSTVMITAFVAVLAALFFLTHNLIFTVIAVVLVVFVISGLYALLKGEMWSVWVQDGVLGWSYARWPRSHGSVDLRNARRIVVNDCSSTLLFTFEDGTSRKIKLVGSGSRFRDYLKTAFPNIELEFIEET
jgi:hypothetical protein